MASNATRPVAPARPATAPVGGLARAARAVTLFLLVVLTGGAMGSSFWPG
ncbi:MAG: hypothetical protein M3Q10_19055 [Chloroflexota bacterium]|nr:hypothetical protein [Chloroflexota bacterium]